MEAVKASTRKAGKVKAHKRRLKGGGTVMVKAASRKTARVGAHKKRAKGHGRKVRNTVGRMVYAGNK